MARTEQAPHTLHHVTVPHPPGSLVERELSAVRLTEGLMRFVLCRGRYLQLLRHGAKHRATSPYAGEASPFGNVFTMPEQLDHALPSPQGEGLKVRVLRHHRAAHPRPLPHFQSSMLLHNLSRDFSLSKKASQRALRCTHLPHRTAAITHPAANAHQAAPVSADHRRSLHAPGRKPAPAPAASAAKQVFHNLSTEFSTISPVFHSGFLSPWLSLRETG